jgi:hypothetical protein
MMWCCYSVIMSSLNLHSIVVYFDSSVDIVTRLRAGRPTRNRSSIPGRDRDSFVPFTAFGPLQEPIEPHVGWVPAAFSPKIKGLEVFPFSYNLPFTLWAVKTTFS